MKLCVSIMHVHLQTQLHVALIPSWKLFPHKTTLGILSLSHAKGNKQEIYYWIFMHKEFYQKTGNLVITISLYLVLNTSYALHIFIYKCGQATV